MTGEVQAVESIQCVGIDRHRHELPVNACEDAVFIGSPRCKSREIVKYFLGVRVEDVRSIFMHQNSGVVVVIVCVPCNMVALVDDQDLCVELARQTFREHGSGEASPDDHVIKHWFRSFPLLYRLRNLRHPAESTAESPSTFLETFCPKMSLRGSYRRGQSMWWCPSHEGTVQWLHQTPVRPVRFGPGQARCRA